MFADLSLEGEDGSQSDGDLDSEEDAAEEAEASQVAHAKAAAAALRSRSGAKTRKLPQLLSLRPIELEKHYEHLICLWSNFVSVVCKVVQDSTSTAKHRCPKVDIPSLYRSSCMRQVVFLPIALTVYAAAVAVEEGEEDDIDTAMAELDMDKYDEDSEEEGGGVHKVFGNSNPGLVYYANEAADPYLKLAAVSDNDSEADDMELREDDFVLLAARNQDDVSHLEVGH